MSKNFPIPRIFPLMCLFLTNYAFAEQVHVFHREIDGVKLEYRISLPKDTFFIYQPINVKLWVTNLSKKSIPLEKIDYTRNPTNNTHAWSIQDRNGKNYPSHLWIGYEFITKDPKLKPCDSIGGVMGLNIYGITDTTQLYPHDFFPNGVYTAKYRLDSVPFLFRVIEPTGEEAKALNTYLNAFYPSRWDTINSITSSEERIKLFNKTSVLLLEMVANYPNSLYSPLALSHARGINTDSIYTMVRRLIKEFPQKGPIYIDALKFYSEWKNDEFRLREELKKIIEEESHPELIAKAKEELKAVKMEIRKRNIKALR